MKHLLEIRCDGKLLSSTFVNRIPINNAEIEAMLIEIINKNRKEKPIVDVESVGLAGEAYRPEIENKENE